MKEIYYEIKTYLKSDFKPSVYIYTILFVYICLTLNYVFGIDKLIVSIYYGKPKGYIVYPLLYIFSYFAVLIPILFIKKQTHKLKSKEFWIKSLVFITLFGVLATFYQYKILAEKLSENTYESFYLKKIFSNIKRFVPFVIVLFLVKLAYDRKTGSFYGLRFGGLNYKPYFSILLLLVPLVIFASFLPEFQSYYPRLKFWNYPEMFGMSVVKSGTIFELAYGLDFISTELFFRGALVVGMAKVLGKDAILPMASFYCFVHFGKPVGEAISSFIGGYILGIIALNHKNINGGIIVHLGIAMLMELAAIIQHFANN